ncbi:MAG: acetolactate synthase [Verrucomicrobiales bacterium]|nr:acetolactate synthase [Verrucomicrobiales bacterium]
MEIEEPDPDQPSAISTGNPVRQLAVFLENQTGALLSIVQLLSDNNVLVLGLSVRDSIDATVVRLIVSDPETVEAIFMERGIAYSMTHILVVELANGAEQLPSTLRSIMNAETNIHFVYPILTRPNGKPAIALCVEDNEFARRVLTDEGYKVLMQEDLSR